MQERLPLDHQSGVLMTAVGWQKNNLSKRCTNEDTVYQIQGLVG